MILKKVSFQSLAECGQRFSGHGKRHPVVLSWDLPLRTYRGFKPF